VPGHVAAALLLAPGRGQVPDPDALSGQLPSGSERVVGEFPELRGHRPATQLGVSHDRGAVPDPRGEMGLADPGRVPQAGEQAACLDARGSDSLTQVGQQVVSGCR
jgi:hypothetical protein